jgi:putative membrane protein
MSSRLIPVNVRRLNFFHHAMKERPSTYSLHGEIDMKIKLLIAPLLLALAGAAFAQGPGGGPSGPGTGPGMMGYYWNDFGGYGMGLGLLFMLAFWGAVIAGIVYLVKRLGSGNSAETRESRALAILQERYARGEIGAEEYRQKKQDLRAA